jgi:hypothetical protein
MGKNEPLHVPINSDHFVFLLAMLVLQFDVIFSLLVG